MRARRVSPGLTCSVLSVVLAVQFPEAEIYLGGGDSAPRILGPVEYGPMLVGLALVVGLAPRFYDWDRHGALGTRVLALAVLAVTVLVPVAIFSAIALSNVDPTYGSTPGDLAPYGSNIAVAAALAFTLVGTIGRLAGTLLWATTLLLLMLWQASTPPYGHLLPLTAHFSADAGIDANIRWAWIILLLTAATGVAWFRRAVPVALTTRPGEE